MISTIKLVTSNIQRCDKLAKWHNASVLNRIIHIDAFIPMKLNTDSAYVCPVTCQTVFKIPCRSSSTTLDRVMNSSFLNTSQKGIKESVFGNTFEDVIECGVSDLTNRNLDEVAQWLEKVLSYNVPHGKKNRGTCVIKSFEMLASKQQLTPDNIYLAQLLGWCVELVQAFFLIEDDIMDQSITRRGRPCWYKNDGVGFLGINDGIFLENLVYVILKRHFSNHFSYVDLLETFHDNIWLTLSGQSLDMLSTPTSTRPDLTKFTLDRYNKIVVNKTCYYTIVLPVKLAILLAGKKDAYTDAVQKLLIEIGHYFQVQDDILDCFGDPNITGKVGTDVEDGKCCWPVVMALGRASPEQFTVLQDNYGLHEVNSTHKVKELYRDLGILQLYGDYEKEIYASLCSGIEMLPPNCEIPKSVFYGILNTIHKRIV